MDRIATAAPAAGTVPAPTAGRIGPNAITRTAEALDAALGAATVADVFGRAGLQGYLGNPPQDMVDETEVLRLHAVLYERLPAHLAARVGRDAGRRTGDYLLAHRIPRSVQRLLRLSPTWAASRVLLAAIKKNAWTFAGTAHFCARGARPVHVRMTGCPLCRGAVACAPRCDFYAGCFERLFQSLVHRRAHVAETACQACGAAACCFVIDW